MANFIARTFVIAFVLLYFVVILGWLVWDLRSWFVARFSKGVRAGVRTHFHLLDLFHHNRHAH